MNARYSFDAVFDGLAPDLGKSLSLTEQIQNWQQNATTAISVSSEKLNGASGVGSSVHLTQYYDATDSRYEFSGNQDIDALLIGSKWSVTSLTFSFPSSGTLYQAEYYNAGYVSQQSAFNLIQQAGARYAFSLVDGYTLLSISEISETSVDHANIRLSLTSDPSLSTAEANFPGSESWDGDIWLSTSDDPVTYAAPQVGNWAFATILHEIGHSLGLKHGHQDYSNVDLSADGYVDGPGPRYGTRALPAQHDSWAYSLMTYRSDAYNSPGDVPSFQGDEFNQPQTFMQNDIAALQFLYGADFSTQADDTVYAFSETTGQMFINGIAQLQPTQNGGLGKIFRTIWDGNGIDTYNFENFTGNQTINLAPGSWSTMNTTQLSDLRPLDDDFTIAAPGNIANAWQYNGDTRSLIENANGGSGADIIYGNDIANALNGNDGNDRLYGYSGNDNLLGEAGNDYLDGWSGNDSLDGAAGYDTLWGYSGNDSLSGGAESDTLNGESGNDYLNGGTGIDDLIGGSGNDTYVIDDAGDIITELYWGGGIELVYASLTYSLDPELENLTLLGTSALSGIGNSDNNVITGNSGDNYLDGGEGADELAGRAGDDVYVVDNNYDLVTELVNEGTDTVRSSLLTFSLAANIENMILTGSASNNGTGNGLNNVITGNDGANILVGGKGLDTLIGGLGDDHLDGGEGADSLTGGLGNDVYSVESLNDLIIELLDQGTDTIKTNMNGYVLGATFENLALTGSAAINGTGNNANNLVTGNGANNILAAGKGDDTLQGGGGDDVLNGGTGSDRMNGGSGNDTYWFGSGDRIDEPGDGGPVDGGIDTVMSTVRDYSLASNLEHLTLVGDGAVNGTGNAKNNIITGNGLNNVLQGGDGNDSITGLEGADTLAGGRGNDVINGGDGNDVLFGGEGGDRLTGGSGNDIFLFQKLVESPSTARDTITDLSLTDILDLSRIDANVHVGGDQAFHQVVAFTGQEAEMVLTYNAGTNRTVLTVDANGDTIADFALIILGNHTGPTGWLL